MLNTNHRTKQTAMPTKHPSAPTAGQRLSKLLTEPQSCPSYLQDEVFPWWAVSPYAQAVVTGNLAGLHPEPGSQGSAGETETYGIESTKY
ncbi:hypothetical protein CEXT_787101 [Caerostris extrusa]|uniref:Uncharacterized protein n=1 Tax=Caerostris extrusa TaxID=172846 RepID=A0AAV4M880_CAEEX|nr:hypothetical protein CEXT_787101 [Caerostris extrusa]